MCVSVWVWLWLWVCVWCREGSDPCPLVSLTASWCVRRTSPLTGRRHFTLCSRGVACENTWVGAGLRGTERSSARNVPMLFWVSSLPPIQSCHLVRCLESVDSAPCPVLLPSSQRGISAYPQTHDTVISSVP